LVVSTTVRVVDEAVAFMMAHVVCFVLIVRHKKTEDGVTFCVTVVFGYAGVSFHEFHYFVMDQMFKTIVLLLVMIVVIVVVVVVVLWGQLTLGGLSRTTGMLVEVNATVSFVDDTVTFMMTYSVC